MADYDPATRTRTLSRIAGPYLAVMGGTLILRAGTMDLMLPAFVQNGPLVLATGAFTLTAGLTIIAAHHHFSSAAAIVISVIGIAAALKGAWLMLAPELGAPLTAAIVRTPPILIVLAFILLLIGLWLSFLGWSAKTSTAGKTL
ncbi:MAG: hypothetical protein ABWZ40_02725 [Caulobacterales bacterium]